MTHQELQKTEQIYHGKVLNLRLDTVVMTGLDSTITTLREVVEHGPAVTVVAVKDDNGIVMVRQHRWATGHTLLEAPAGRVESGEIPADAAIRELREETGYAANSLLHLGGFWMAPGYSTEYMTVYRADDLYSAYLPADVDEDISVVLVDQNDLPGLIRDGIISDAKTIAALYIADVVGNHDDKSKY